MNQVILKVGLLLITLIQCSKVVAQQPTFQDCLGAIPVCGQIYEELQVPDGFGAFEGEVDNDITCLFDDSRAIWYTFTVNSSGDFGFLLTPQDPDDDYDWALYNLTNARCDQIRTNPDLLVSCNAAGSFVGDSPYCNGQTGATGGSNFNIQGGGCGNAIVTLRDGNSPLNDLIPVVEGNTYALIVSNFSQSTNGYTIDFGFSGDIGIIDNKPPEIKDFLTDVEPGCSPNFVDISFTELINCNSISDPNFSLIDDAGNSYPLRIVSEECNVGATFSKDYILEIVDFLPVGNFDLQINSTDFFKINDPCQNSFTTFQYDLNIQVDTIGAINLPSDTLICDLPSVVVDVTDPVADAYRWADGSTQAIREFTESGTYTVELSNLCQSKSATIDVTILNERNVVVELGRDTSLCLGESFPLSTNLGSALMYDWSDGLNTESRTVTTTGVYGVIVSDACGELGRDEVDIEFKDIPIDLNLGQDTFYCTGDVINLDVTDINADAYLWEDGSADPLRVIDIMGVYSVSVSNECLEEMDEITINESACIDCNVYLPNTLRINGEGENAQFGVVGNCPFIEYSLNIYDRWGGLVFTSMDPEQNWNGLFNGEPVNSGAYPYVVRLSYLEFDELIIEEIPGTITVIR